MSLCTPLHCGDGLKEKIKLGTDFQLKFFNFFSPLATTIHSVCEPDPYFQSGDICEITFPSTIYKFERRSRDEIYCRATRPETNSCYIITTLTPHAALVLPTGEVRIHRNDPASGCCHSCWHRRCFSDCLHPVLHCGDLLGAVTRRLFQPLPLSTFSNKKHHS